MATRQQLDTSDPCLAGKQVSAAAAGGKNANNRNDECWQSNNDCHPKVPGQQGNPYSHSMSKLQSIAEIQFSSV